jgi:hypothetical protein
MAATIRLKLIHFHSPANPVTVPLARMKGESAEAVPTPEWKPGRAAADSLVAINMKPQPSAMPLRVKLHRSNTSTASVLLSAVAAESANILHSVPETPVSFPGSAKTVEVDLELRLSLDGKVGKQIDRLVWQYRTSISGAHTRLTETEHTVFKLLDTPAEPWSASTAATRVWTDVLEFACEWAARSSDENAAASEICRRFFQLGEPPQQQPPPLLSYCGAAQYAGDRFDCADFVRTLRGDPNQARRVNCSDAAAVISTFAAALGAKLVQQRTKPAGPSHPIRLIGRSTVQVSNAISYHELAWGEGGSPADPVWDGSLELHKNPAAPQLAAGIPFTSYVPLYTPGCMSADCSTRRVRRLGNFQGKACVMAKRAATSVSGALPGPSILVLRLSPRGLLPGWRLVRDNTFHCGQPDLVFFDAYYRPEEGREGVLLRVQSALLANNESAANYLRAQVEHCSALSPDADTGETSFRLDDGSAAGFQTGNASLVLLNAGPVNHPLLDAARPLARQLGMVPDLLPAPAPAPPAAPGELPEIEVMTVPPGDDGGVWYRWVTRSGRLVYRDGRVILLPYSREAAAVAFCRQRSPEESEVSLLRL